MMRNFFVLAIFYFVPAQGGVHNLTGQFQAFSSSGYPGPYSNNLDDTWRITVQPGFRVALYFTSFELEDSFDDVICSQDYVEIGDGSNSTTRLCGNPRLFSDDAPQIFTSKYRSSSNTMEVRMVSDYSNNLGAASEIDEPLTGFKAHFYKEDINECKRMRSGSGPVCGHFCNNYPGGYYCSCRYGYKLHTNGHSCVGDCSGKILSDPSGQVQSPGYPNPYPGLTNCSWNVKTDPGKQLEIEFNPEFAIEDHFSAHCPYDYLKINDSSGQVGPLFCGNLAPFNGSVIRSTTNWFQIHFYSDDVTELTGFQFTYKSAAIVCQLPPPPTHGRLSHVTGDGLEQTASDGFVPFSALILFDCNEGFRLIGSGKIACLKDGSLSDRPPICVPF